MNKLEEKAEELANMARQYGLEPVIQKHGDWYVNVDYHKSFYSHVSYTDTGRVSVKTWEKVFSKWESVALKSLDEYLEFASKQIGKTK
jgi:hypothetical protein